MGLRDENTIDIVMDPRPGHPEDGKLVLLILDAVPMDEPTRLELLARKLRAYVQYVADDGFRRERGLAPGDVRIKVVCFEHNPPTGTMLKITGVQPHGQPDASVPVAFVFYGKGFP